MSVQKPEVHVLKQKQSSIAFAYSSKERMEFTAQTIPPLLAETGYDIFWIDGSTSDAGKTTPFQYASSGRIHEIHLHVRGGADAAILYALSTLLDRGYDYIGLVENDVKLLAGWWPAIFGLFARGKADGLNVGAVSARCHKERILVPRDGYAVMHNHGAGMVLFTREAVQRVLGLYRTGNIGELSFLFMHYVGLYVGIPWQINDPATVNVLQTRTTGDWFFEASLLPYGLAALALTPTYAENLDDPNRYVMQRDATQADPNYDWKGLCARFAQNAANAGNDFVGGLIPHYDLVLKQWRAYPHQIVKAFPHAFDNNWRCVWSKFMGPFGFKSLRKGAKLELLVHGVTFGFLTESAEPFTVLINGNNRRTVESGWQMVTLNSTDSGPYPITIEIEKENVVVAAFSFEGPQNWMRNHYDLRYSDLARYIENV